MINTFFYTLGQGVKNVFRNKWFTMASLATISACLFVFGIFVAVVFNVNHIVKTVEEGVSVTVYFNEDVEQERIDQIRELVTRRPEVYRCDFISADEAWAEFSKKLGENAEGFTENPLANSENLQIYLNDVSKQGELVGYLETVEGGGSYLRFRRHDCTASCRIHLLNQQYRYHRYFRQKRRNQHYEICRCDGLLRTCAVRIRRNDYRTDRFRNSGCCTVLSLQRGI